MPRPDYTLYEKGVQKAKDEKSKMYQAAYEEYARKRHAYFEGVARGEIQISEGRSPGFPKMEGCLG